MYAQELFQKLFLVMPTAEVPQARDGSCATAVTKAAAVTTWILSPLHHKRTPLAQFLNRSVPLQ